jgi:Uri superfamily endonuclease
MNTTTEEPGIYIPNEDAETERPSTTRVSRVINRDYVKRWALDYARTNRSHPFTRVSEQFLNAIEAATKAAIRDKIDRAPSKGKTLL